MRIAIFYATREGQTRRIAQHLAGALLARGAIIDLFDVASLAHPVDFDNYGAAIVAASVHIGKHEPEMVKFVKQHRAELDAVPSVFISVSLSAAGVGMPTRTPEQQRRAKAEVEGVLETFYRQTGWKPARVMPTAGALLYTKYNFLIRFVMKQISKAAGGSIDTTRDHDYTDWAALDRLAGEIVPPP